MTFRELVPVGALGQRIRNALVAGALLACVSSASQLVRNPAWDGWWDAYNWPQLFLYGPVLFFFCAAVWQLICVVAEWLYRKAKGNTEILELKTFQDTQRTLKFWLRDSWRVCVLYITTSVIGDSPMAVNYVAAIRGWPMHL